MKQITEEQIKDAAEAHANDNFQMNDLCLGWFAAKHSHEAGAKWMQEKMQREWIDVKEKLPDYGVKVLCFGHEMGMNPQMGGYYTFISMRIELLKERHNRHLNSQLDENGFRRAYVINWQPLPKPPTK